MAPPTDSQTTGLLINIFVGLPATLLCLLLFTPLRRSYPTIFLARHHANLPTPPIPAPGLLSWLRPTLSNPLSALSHDASLFLTFLLTQFYFFLTLSLLAVLLLPIYYTASHKSLPETNPLHTLGVNQFSLSNVPSTDHARFWLLLVLEYVLFAYVVRHLLSHFSLYCAARRRYRAKNIPANYAILVQDIPKDAYSRVAVRSYWQRLLPGLVETVLLVHDGRKIEREKKCFWNAVEKREAAERRVWKGRDQCEGCKAAKGSEDENCSYTLSSVSTLDITSKQSMEPARPPGKNLNVDWKQHWRLFSPREAGAAARYWEVRQRYCYDKVYVRQRVEEEITRTQSAIVVFRTRHAASIAAQTNFSTRENAWRVCRAPEPEAIDWAQMVVRGRTVYVRQAVTVLLATAFTLFWIIPITGIMGLANLSKLAQIEINGNTPFLFLEDVKNWSKITTGLIESWFPAVILMVFLSIVPKVLQCFVSISRIPSKAKQDSLVRDWYFVFVMFSNFLFVAFAGTLLEELATIVDRPARTVEILASNIPNQAAFMMNFIILGALTEAPRELLQLFRVGGRWVTLTVFAKTDRQREEAEIGDHEMNYVKFYAFSQLVSLLGLVYCTIQPFIIPCCAAYFGISYVVFKYNLCFSLYNEYEDGGRMYGGALYSVWAGLFAHLLTMIGVFGLNKNPAQSALIIIPTVLSVLFLFYCRKSFDRVIEHGSALETQNTIEELEGPDAVCEGLLDSYIHPGFGKLPEEVENRSGVPGIKEKNCCWYLDEESDTESIEQSLEEIVTA